MYNPNIARFKKGDLVLYSARFGNTFCHHVIGIFLRRVDPLGGVISLLTSGKIVNRHSMYCEVIATA